MSSDPFAGFRNVWSLRQVRMSKEERKTVERWPTSTAHVRCASCLHWTSCQKNERMSSRDKQLRRLYSTFTCIDALTITSFCCCCNPLYCRMSWYAWKWIIWFIVATKIIRGRKEFRGSCLERWFSASRKGQRYVTKTLVLFLVEKSLGNNNCLIDCLIACLCVRRVKKTSKNDFRQNTSYEVFQCWEHDSEVSSVADQLGGGGRGEGWPLGVKKTSETDFPRNAFYEILRCRQSASRVCLIG